MTDLEIVRRAAGVVAEEVGCDAEDALALMRERAERDGLTIEETANRVLHGSMRFGK